MPIDDMFSDVVNSNIGCAVIIAGSDSDDKVKETNKLSHVGKIAASLERFGVPYQVRVASGHKQGEKFQCLIDDYDKLEGDIVYIDVAGLTDAISGTSSFRSWRLTISCPPDHPNNSCITNPPGSSNVYVGNPDNAGRAVAQIFAYKNPFCRQAIIDEINKKRADLDKADDILRSKYNVQQGRI